MKEKIIKLIDVKSIVTLVLMVVFAVLSLKSQVSPEQFQTVFTTVIAFYFGTQNRQFLRMAGRSSERKSTLIQRTNFLKLTEYREEYCIRVQRHLSLKRAGLPHFRVTDTGT